MNLPNEIIYKVFLYLKLDDIINCFLVNKKYNLISRIFINEYLSKIVNGEEIKKSFKKINLSNKFIIKLLKENFYKVIYDNNILCYIYFDEMYFSKFSNERYFILNNKEICKKIINNLINIKNNKIKQLIKKLIINDNDEYFKFIYHVKDYKFEQVIKSNEDFLYRLNNNQQKFLLIFDY